jgi:hypothetical protein
VRLPLKRYCSVCVKWLITCYIIQYCRVCEMAVNLLYNSVTVVCEMTVNLLQLNGHFTHTHTHYTVSNGC